MKYLPYIIGAVALYYFLKKDDEVIIPERDDPPSDSIRSPRRHTSL